MDICEIYEQFTTAMTRIELHQRTAFKTSQQELLALRPRNDPLKPFTIAHKILPFSAHNMYFRNAITGEECFLGGTIVTAEQRILDVTMRRNKQYLWLLAEAYENLEDLLDRVYAFCGHTNANSWLLADFGGISLSELPDKDFYWHLERVKEKKGRPHSLVKQMRKNFPKLEEIERKNMLEVDLKFMMIFIQELRHIIVHKGGITKDIDAFMGKVFQAAGISPKGEKADAIGEYVKEYFRLDGTAQTIFLVEPKVFNGMPFYAGGGNFGKVFGYIASYGNLICEIVGLPESMTMKV